MSEPTLRDAISFLEQQREDWRRGWRENGAVTDPNAKHAIACLTVAIDKLENRPPRNSPHIAQKSLL